MKTTNQKLRNARFANTVELKVLDYNRKVAHSLQDELQILEELGIEDMKNAARLLIRDRCSFYGFAHRRQFKGIANTI